MNTARTHHNANLIPPREKRTITKWDLGFAALMATTLLAFALLAVPGHAAQPVELKREVQASGPALTLNDLFIDAGANGDRAVAPAPRPGQSSALSAQFLVAAAAAAGLDFVPPQGMDQITVTRSGGGASTLPAPRQQGGIAQRQFAEITPVSATSAPPLANAAIRRGDMLTLVYVAPGLQLTTRAKALNDAGVGDAVRVVNLQSNRVVDAVVTGPGAASASPGPSF